MDKQEIQKEIDKANLDIYATNQRISKLQEELAPKRRHGDFGMYESGNSWILLKRNEPYLEIFGTKSGSGCDDETIKPDDVLGNIFDLLKNDEFLEMIATLKRKQS